MKLICRINTLPLPNKYSISECNMTLYNISLYQSNKNKRLVNLHETHLNSVHSLFPPQPELSGSVFTGNSVSFKNMVEVYIVICMHCMY